MVRGTTIPLMGLDGDDGDALSSLVDAAADEEGGVAAQPTSKQAKQHRV